MLSGTWFGRLVWWMLRVIKHPRQLPLSCCCCCCWCRSLAVQWSIVMFVYFTMSRTSVCIWEMFSVGKMGNKKLTCSFAGTTLNWAVEEETRALSKQTLRTISSCTLAVLDCCCCGNERGPKESESHFKCGGAEKANILLSLQRTNIQMCLIKLSIRFWFAFFLWILCRLHFRQNDKHAMERESVCMLCYKSNTSTRIKFGKC